MATGVLGWGLRETKREPIAYRNCHGVTCWAPPKFESPFDPLWPEESFHVKTCHPKV